MAQTEIQAPLAKASAAIGAGVGSSLLSTAQSAADFWPATYAEWAAAIASTLAAMYSLFLISEWLWKKAKKWGWA